MEKPLKKGFSFTLRRSMRFRVENTIPMSSEELILKLHKSANLYKEYADTTLLFIFREGKSDVYDYYEVRFGKNNFMHLAGIKSCTLNAIDFYEACVNGTVTKEDCTPRKNANTMYSKVSIMEQMLDLRNSKCYKIGEKNLVTRDNDFEMATGNSNGVIGYDSRITMSGSNKVDKTKAPIPTALLNNPITDYCTKPQKIMFIMQKSDVSGTYKDLFYEIKNGLFQTEREFFSDELKALIS